MLIYGYIDFNGVWNCLEEGASWFGGVVEVSLSAPLFSSMLAWSQLTITCSKSTKETLEKGLKYVQS